MARGYTNIQDTPRAESFSPMTVGNSGRSWKGKRREGGDGEDGYDGVGGGGRGGGNQRGHWKNHYRENLLPPPDGHYVRNTLASPPEWGISVRRLKGCNV